jgi:hypothetical protein
MPLDITSFAIPLWAFLAVFGLFLLFFLVHSFFNLYHFLRFGIYGFGLYGITTLFVFGTFALLGISTLLLLPYDWTASLQLSTLFGSFDSGLFPGLN